MWEGHLTDSRLPLKPPAGPVSLCHVHSACHSHLACFMLRGCFWAGPEGLSGKKKKVHFCIYHEKRKATRCLVHEETFDENKSTLFGSHSMS